jgi:hypothetical protein
MQQSGERKKKVGEERESVAGFAGLGRGCLALWIRRAFFEPPVFVSRSSEAGGFAGIL